MIFALYHTFHAPVNRSLPSTSKSNRSPEKNFTQINSKILTDDIVNYKPLEIDVTYWSQLCVDMLDEKDTLGWVLQILVRCCAMDFKNVNLDERDISGSQWMLSKLFCCFAACVLPVDMICLKKKDDVLTTRNAFEQCILKQLKRK